MRKLSKTSKKPVWFTNFRFTQAKKGNEAAQAHDVHYLVNFKKEITDKTWWSVQEGGFFKSLEPWLVVMALAGEKQKTPNASAHHDFSPKLSPPPQLVLHISVIAKGSCHLTQSLIKSLPDAQHSFSPKLISFSNYYSHSPLDSGAFIYFWPANLSSQAQSLPNNHKKWPQGSINHISWRQTYRS